MWESAASVSPAANASASPARALYKQASVLVFDEATGALDNATEQSVMDAIEGLNRDLTILLAPTPACSRGLLRKLVDFDKTPIHSVSVDFHSLPAVSLPAVSLPRFAPENWPEVHKGVR